MKVETYKCDVCRKQKGEVNHWWVMNWCDYYIVMKSWDSAVNGGELNSHNALHLCGAECVQKKVNEFLGSKA